MDIYFQTQAKFQQHLSGHSSAQTNSPYFKIYLTEIKSFPLTYNSLQVVELQWWHAEANTEKNLTEAINDFQAITVLN